MLLSCAISKPLVVEDSIFHCRFKAESKTTPDLNAVGNVDRGRRWGLELLLVPHPHPKEQRRSCRADPLVSLMIYDPAVGRGSQLLKVKQVLCDKEWLLRSCSFWV